MKPRALKATTDGVLKSVRFTREEWEHLEREAKKTAHTAQKGLRFLVIEDMERAKRRKK